MSREDGKTKKKIRSESFPVSSTDGKRDVNVVTRKPVTNNGQKE